MKSLRPVIVVAATTFAMAEASRPADALPLAGPPNNLQGSGTIAAPGNTLVWLFEANPADGSASITGIPAPSVQISLELTDPGNFVIAAATSAAALVNGVALGTTHDS